MTDETAIAPEGAPEEDATCLYVDRVITFYLDSQRYALPIDRVQEIQQIVAFSEVPSGGSGVVGMVNLRGHVIPAVDLRQVVGLGPKEYDLETPMIICRIKGQLVALVVDEVQDVLELPDGCLQAAPPMHSLSSKMLGVARMSDGLIYLFDLDPLLASTLSGGW
ncbi:MAG: chemotaxis protein CheW [Coriobacteriia bacterium]|nr:chemotaxis protein CheW [Coriobacteriia bacterium]